MSKKSSLIGFLLFLMAILVVSSAHAEEPVWLPAMEIDFTASSSVTPEVVTQLSPQMTLTRSIDINGNRWKIQSGAREFVSIPLEGFVFPSEFQYRLDLTLQLPNSDGYLCAGFALNYDTAATFSSFLICNDHTYGAISHENGSWEPLISFNALPDYDWNAPVTFSIQLNQNWADFYFADQLLDTAPLPAQLSSLSLFAQPISDREVEVLFKKVKLSVAKAEAISSGLPENTPADAAKIVRLLRLKDRFPASSFGTVLPYENLELSLAQMGFHQSQMVNQSARDLLIRSHISWKSAYPRPNYDQSGCGFTFRSKAADSQMQVFLSLDGAVYLSAQRNGAMVPLASYNYANWSLEGDGILTLVVTREKITVLFDDRILGTVTDATWIAEGDLGFTVWSGTNYETGITCSFSDNTILLFEGKDL